ncbi:MAG: phage fiber-tail adaptor protein [Candidatus Thorarchaeota archaeon]
MTAYDFLKDPESILDYGFDWSKWLVGDDYIVDSAWAISPTGDLEIVTDSDTFDGTSTLVRLEGGVVGNTYYLTNHITTANGLEDERTMRIYVANR